MQNYFQKDNSWGYSDEEIQALNAILADEALRLGYDPDDMDAIESLAERIQMGFDTWSQCT